MRASRPIEKPRPPRRAFRFRTPILPISDREGDLLGLLTGSSTSVRLACGCHLAVMVHPKPPRRNRAAFPPQHGGRRHALLLGDIIYQGKGHMKILPAARCTVLRKVRGGFENQVGIGDQVSEGLKGCAVNWHTFIVRWNCAKSKR